MRKEVSLPHGRILLLRGDITRQPADAIVNAANSSLIRGGGVDGAIHAAAGPELQDACNVLGGCPTGHAVITPAFRLPARFVIHAVGPVWQGGRKGEAGLLRSAYRTCLALAERESLESIAFPAISTGVYGYPMEEAAGIALDTAREHLSRPVSLREIIFVLFDDRAWEVFACRAGEQGA
jgi:O-acetyl-ADP-ribose deacetylase